MSELPGIYNYKYRGMVRDLGWDQTGNSADKISSALDFACAELSANAIRMGTNAIVGVNSRVTNGAITGVVLIGTAVTVIASPAPQTRRREPA